MSAYLNKQQSCCVDAEGRVVEPRDGQAPCSCSWQPPQPPHGHGHGHGHGYGYQGSPCTSTMPRQRAKLTATRSESSWRSPSRTMLRSKGGSCDQWTDCGCQHGWTEPYQVKPERDAASGGSSDPASVF